MEALPANSSFSKAHLTLQLAWDSTSLSALKKCPRYYELSIIQGWRPHGEAVDLSFGIWFHGATERYDHARSAGLDHEASLRKALRYAMESTWNSDLSRPWVSDHPQKNRRTLIQLVIWYLDRFGAQDIFQTVQLASGKPAVELSFRLELDYTSHLTGETFLLCGHLDRVATLNGTTYILDRKTTKAGLDDKYFDQFSPHNQFTTYVFAAGVVYNLPIRAIYVDAAQVTATLGPRFDRREIQRTQSQLDEWHRDLGFWLTAAQLHARANYWPMNEASCFRCDFRGICSKPKESREEWLKARFHRRIWDPLVVRGDI